MLRKAVNAYLKKYDLTITLFAAKCRLSYGTVKNILDNPHKISRKTAEALFKGTKGEISMENLKKYIYKPN
jgi:lambda repressor-like predicted transcriptional regulator